MPDVAGFSFLQAFDAAIPTWWPAVPRGVPLLTGWAAGPQLPASLDAGASDSALRDAIVTSLAHALGTPADVVARQLLDVHTHDWSADRFVGGAYTRPPACARCEI